MVEQATTLAGKHVRYKGVTYRVVSGDESDQILELALPFEKPFKIKRIKVTPLTAAEEIRLATFMAGHSGLHAKLVTPLSA